MLTRKSIIIKATFFVFIIIPYLYLLAPIDFIRYLTVGIFGFYFLINIIVFFIKKKNFNVVKYILNTLDGLLILFAVGSFVFFEIIAFENVGESAFLFLVYPIVGAIAFIGILGLFLTNGNLQKP